MNLRRPFRPRDSAPGLRIFLSYRRGDAAGHAGRLYDALAARFGADSVFIDVDAIDLGADFRQTIDAAIASCDVAIALIGPGWLSAADADGRRRVDDPDDVLRLELERALAHDLVVIPALVQAAPLPSREELPAPLVPLAGRQGIELRDAAWRDDVARLVRRLEGFASTRAGEGTAAGRTGRRRPRLWQLLAGTAVIVALAAALALTLRADEGGGGTSAGATAAERRLLAAIPLPLRTDCGSIDWGPEAALASVSCQAARVNVSYHLFETQRVLDAWYAIEREETGIEPETGSCEDTAFRGEAAYAVGDGVVGRSFCFVDEGEPKLRWTDERATIGAEANVWDGTGPEAIRSLLRAWRCCLELEP